MKGGRKETFSHRGPRLSFVVSTICFSDKFQLSIPSGGAIMDYSSFYPQRAAFQLERTDIRCVASLLLIDIDQDNEIEHSVTDTWSIHRIPVRETRLVRHFVGHAECSDYLTG